MNVVINKCFGGFGVSPEALYELIQRGADCVQKTTLRKYYGTAKDDLHQRECDLKRMEPFFGRFKVDKFRGLLADNRYVYYLKSGYGIRTDKNLISVVRGMGKKANSMFAELKVVCVPDGVEYSIDEYDGNESIHETHRIWG